MTEIKIIDNFLSDSDFKKITSLTLDQIPENSIKVYHNEIDKRNNIQKSCLESSLIETLHKNYHQKAFKILENLNYKKSKLYDYSDFTIIKTGKNYKYPIHDDTPNKLLSGVIYLQPKINTGTIFYKNKKGAGREEVEWKENRAVFFSRTERESWHSYQGNGISDRVALVFNIMTTNIKEVYKIEKKSYFLGNLRYKLNPYIFNYFKLVI